jgi:hypothetical protein
VIRLRLSRVLLAALFAALAAAGSGCSTEFRIQVESAEPPNNNCWRMSVDNQNTSEDDRCQSTSYRVVGNFKCVRVQNLSTFGFVRVRINNGPWSESTLPQGSVQSCK